MSTYENAMMPAVRRTLEEDRAGDRLRSLSEYLSLFPGDDAGVAREYLGFVTRELGNAVALGARLGNYRIVKELGRGGQGTVYLAEDESLGRQVALKVLEGFAASNPEILQRFRREAMAASALQHPGICAVYEAGIDARVPFIAMQFVPGTTLARKIADTRESLSEATERDGTPSSELFIDLDAEVKTVADPAPQGVTAGLERDSVFEFLGIVEKAARALHSAHEAGVIHRDIKPGNIMVTPAGEAVILDFGLARKEDSALETMTQEGDLFGTPAYMSPEHLARSRIRLDARADVWSLGAVLYECLALKRPFEAETREGLYQAILTRDPLPLHKLSRAVPSDLGVVVQKALEKDRDRRYATALDLAEELRRVREHEPIRARRVGAIGRFARWAKREPAKAGLLVVLFLTLPTIATLVTIWAEGRPLAEQARLLALQEEREAVLADASYELSEGSAARALELYEKALSFEGRSPEAAAGIAFCRIRMKKPDEALQTLEEHRSLLEDTVASHLVRADALRVQGNQADAELLLAKTPPPTTAFDYGVLAQRELMRGDSEATPEGSRETAFRSALQHATFAVLLHRTPRLDLLSLRTHAAGHLADRQAVLESAAALAEHFPRRASAHAWCSFALGNFDDPASIEAALVHAREALRLQPDHDRAHGHAAASLAKLGRWEESLDHALEAARLAPATADNHYNLSINYLQLERHEEAIAELRETLRLNPRHRTAHNNLASALSALGRKEEARVEIEEALRIDPELPEALVSKSQFLFEDGKWSEALEYGRRAVGKGRKDIELLCLMTKCLDRLKREPEALELAREAAREHPDSVLALRNLGTFLTHYGHAAEALPHLEAAIAKKPADDDLRRSLGDALLAVDRPGEALPLFLQALEHEADHAETATSVGLCYERLGRTEEALTTYRKALALEPTLEMAHLGLARCYEATSRPSEAIEAYRKLLELVPASSAGHRDLGGLMTNLGRPDEAIAELKEALRLDPADATAHHFLGVTETRRGNLQAAVMAFSEAIRQDPKSLESRIQLAGRYFELGKFDECRDAAREALRLEPRNAPANFALGMAQLASERPAEAAESLFLATRGNPKDAVAFYNLGNALLLADQTDPAIRAYENALRLNPEHPESHCNLGHALQAAGRHAEALRAFGRGHELGKKTGGWRYPSGEWIEGATLAAKKAAAQAAELDRELQAGKIPDAALDAAADARRLLEDNRPEEALRLFEAAFAKDPELASRVKARHRFHAACAAALVARGADPEGAAGLRAKALRWLDAELEAVREARGADELSTPYFHYLLDQLAEDPRLASLRDEPLSRLPDSERAPFVELWARLASLRGEDDAPSRR